MHSFLLTTTCCSVCIHECIDSTENMLKLVVQLMTCRCGSDAKLSATAAHDTLKQEHQQVHHADGTNDSQAIGRQSKCKVAHCSL